MSWAMKLEPQNQIRVRDVFDFLQFISHYQFRVFSVLKSVEEKEVSADFITTTNSKTRRMLSQKRCKYLSLVLVCVKAPLYAQWNYELALKTKKQRYLQ